MLRIKLVRQGKKDRPTWRVIVVEKTKTGKGNFTDAIGNYNPFGGQKSFVLDVEKFEKYVKDGAQPTDAVLRLKGRFIDKNKDYQKLVKAKVYKKKKKGEGTEGQKNEGTKEQKSGETKEKVAEGTQEPEIATEQDNVAKDENETAKTVDTAENSSQEN